MKTKLLNIILLFLCLSIISKGQTVSVNKQKEISQEFFHLIKLGNLSKILQLLDSSNNFFQDSLLTKSEFINIRKDIWCFDSLQFFKMSKKFISGDSIYTYEYKLFSTKVKNKEFVNNSLKFCFFKLKNQVFNLIRSKSIITDGIELDTVDSNSVKISSDTIISFNNEIIKISNTNLTSLSQKDICFNIVIDYTLPIDKENRNNKAFQIATVIASLYYKNGTYEKAKNQSSELKKYFRDCILVSFFDGSRGNFNLEVDLDNN